MSNLTGSNMVVLTELGLPLLSRLQAERACPIAVVRSAVLQRIELSGPTLNLIMVDSQMLQILLHIMVGHSFTRKMAKCLELSTHQTS